MQLGIDMRPSRYYPSHMAVDYVRLITFDCYGTLIDWETGMLKAMRPLFGGGDTARDIELLALYSDVEFELESGPYMSYRHVLAHTVQEMGNRMDLKIT